MGIERAAANVGKEALLRWSEATGMRGFPPNMRTRNADGALRHTRGDKLLATVREQFQLSKEALAGHSDRMHLSSLRKLRGVDSEKDVLKGTMGLKGGRDVNLDGTIRGKRADTHIGTIEAKYGRIGNHRSDMHLGTLQKKHGVTSQNSILQGEYGLRGGRDINADGTIRAKRGDTHVGTIEKQYHVDFGVRSDMHLSTLKKRLGAESMSDAVRKVRNR